MEGKPDPHALGAEQVWEFPADGYLVEVVELLPHNGVKVSSIPAVGEGRTQFHVFDAGEFIRDYVFLGRREELGG